MPDSTGTAKENGPVTELTQGVDDQWKLDADTDNRTNDATPTLTAVLTQDKFVSQTCTMM